MGQRERELGRRLASAAREGRSSRESPFRPEAMGVGRGDRESRGRCAKWAPYLGKGDAGEPFDTGRSFNDQIHVRRYFFKRRWHVIPLSLGVEKETKEGTMNWMLKRERRGGYVASAIRRCSGFSAAVPAELGRAPRADDTR